MNPSTEKITVWVVDDIPHIRLVIEESLKETSDIECTHCFEDCESALKLLKEKEDPPDTILLDIGLSGISGVDGIKHFRRITPATKIIMLTVSDKTRDIFDAVKQGIDGYILKDGSFTIDKVANSIREAMKGGAPLDPNISKKVMEMLKSMSGPSVDYGITEREKQVIALIDKGLSMQEIGKRLRITYNTVTSHYRNIKAKMNVHKDTEIVSKALKDHII